LPLASVPALEPAANGNKDAAEGGHRTLRVLVVDDNVDAARSLSLFLKRAGNETEVAHDGATALDAAGSFQPDVVLLDIGLPGMNGYEVARSMREKTAATLVAISGYTKEEDDQGAVFDRYLVKPVHPDDLRLILASLGG
jgi:CheY-like chemotaxis protein